VKLNERLSQLLEQSVEAYIKNATPISSGALVESVIKNLSSATVRNDLKTLEQMGYLKQLHTSGGRIPTTAGYRYYIDKVMNEMNIQAGELNFAADTIGNRVAELPKIIDDICKKLQSQFNYPIIVRRKFDHLIVLDIKIVTLIEGATLVLIKTNAGGITQTIETDHPLTDKQCDDASAALGTQVRGKTLKELLDTLPKLTETLSKDLKAFGSLVRKLSEKLEAVLTANSSTHNTIKLLDIPDYANITKLKAVGEAIEDKDTVTKVLSTEGGVVLGSELDNPDLDGASIIKFNYQIGGESIANVGILGPERMDYKNLIIALHSLLDTAQEQRQLSNQKANAPPRLDFKKEKKETK
jgi:heat-inducible transcriptional repressor